MKREREIINKFDIFGSFVLSRMKYAILSDERVTCETGKKVGLVLTQKIRSEIGLALLFLFLLFLW